MKCAVKNCNQESVPYTEPAACPKHDDLQVFVDYLIGQGQPVTVENLKTARAKSVANGGKLAVTDADIETEMAGEFGRQYQEVTQ